MNEKKLLTIGKMAKKCQLNVQTLRYYESIHLIKPQYTDNKTGYRYYSNDQFYDLLLVKHFKSYGFSLIDIKDFLNEKDIDGISNLYLKKMDKIEKKIIELNHIKKKLKNCFKEVNRGIKNSNNKSIGINYFPKRPIIFIRKKIKNTYDAKVQLYNELLNIIQENKITIQSNYMLIYHQNYLNKNMIDLEMCVQLEKIDLNIFDNNVLLPFIRFIPEGDYCCSIFQGTYEESKKRYLQMIEYIKKNEKKTDSHTILYYLIAVAEAKSPEKAVFEFQILIK